jgi:hypothetical protein
LQVVVWLWPWTCVPRLLYRQCGVGFRQAGSSLYFFGIFGEIMRVLVHQAVPMFIGSSTFSLHLQIHFSP